MPARLYFVEDHVTESLNDFNTTQWLAYGDVKLGLQGTNIKLVGVRCWPQAGTGQEETWVRPSVFLYGKQCKEFTQRAMRDGFVELRFSYKPYKDLPY